MPQIKSTLVAEFLHWLLVEKSVASIAASIDAVELKPSQAELHEDNILALIEKPENLKKPLLVSNDGYVLDGHHRWAANARLGNMQQCVLLQTSAQEALSLMKEFGNNKEECRAKA